MGVNTDVLQFNARLDSVNVDDEERQYWYHGGECLAITDDMCAGAASVHLPATAGYRGCPRPVTSPWDTSGGRGLTRSDLVWLREAASALFLYLASLGSTDLTPLLNKIESFFSIFKTI